MGRASITAERRRQIIDATVRVMGEKGWQETSIDEISKAAGVSRGLVSYHFGDKAELLAGVLDRCREVFVDTVASSLNPGLDPIYRLRMITRTAILMARKESTTYDVFLHFTASARVDPGLAERLRDLYRDFRRATAETVRRGQQSGAFRLDIDPEAAAANHIGTIIGIAFQWLLDRDGFDLDLAARNAEDAFVSHLTRRFPVFSEVDG
ncbi:TetR/AcrR family transcriptional regulator [Tepidiforma sp.]|uniref:TetR/AcrR family transcriptional regulator n=1 Tax=Tepidiforma sp. TaxID=2682230 RepID=UPI002ADDE167|nr:TetR family transcriptional regulator C-terminal domain-containing protein [Tepidiforma sp.]